MKIKFEIWPVIACVGCVLGSTFGAYAFFVGIGFLPDIGDRAGIISVQPVLICGGAFICITAIAAMIYIIRIFVSEGVIIIDLEDVRKEELKKETKELFDKFITEHFKD